MALAPPAFSAVASLLGLLLLLGLYYAYGYTIGAWLVHLAGVFNRVGLRIPWVGHVGLTFIGDAILDLDNEIRNALGNGVAFFRVAWNDSVHYLAYAVSETADAIADLADATLSRFQHLTTVTIPRWVGLRLDGVTRRVAALEHEITSLPHRAEIIIHKPVTVIRTEVVKAAHAATAIPLPRLGRLEHDAEALAGRIGRLGRRADAEAAKLTRLNKLTLTGAATALVAAALARLGLGALRCSNTRRAARQLCGMDANLLESLIADTLLIVGTVSIVEFAKGMQDAIGEIEKPIRTFWRAA